MGPQTAKSPHSPLRCLASPAGRRPAGGHRFRGQWSALGRAPGRRGGRPGRRVVGNLLAARAPRRLTEATHGDLPPGRQQLNGRRRCWPTPGKPAPGALGRATGRRRGRPAGEHPSPARPTAGRPWLGQLARARPAGCLPPPPGGAAVPTSACRRATSTAWRRSPSTAWRWRMWAAAGSRGSRASWATPASRGGWGLAPPWGGRPGRRPPLPSLILAYPTLS